MKGITWSRDSHGLFDYESKHLTKKTMRTTEAVSIVRRSNELSMVHYDMDTPLNVQIAANFSTAAPAENLDDKPLLKIINMNNTFYLESTTYSTQI
jgi:hypothetical protein